MNFSLFGGKILKETNIIKMKLVATRLREPLKENSLNYQRNQVINVTAKLNRSQNIRFVVTRSTNENTEKNLAFIDNFRTI